MRARVTIVCVLLVAGIAWWLCRNKPTDNSENNSKNSALEYYEHLKPIRVSGTVVDDVGHPVSGAAVEYIVWGAHFLVGNMAKPAPQSVFSDAQGRFHFLAEKPERIFVRSVTKPGYEAIRSEGDDYSINFARGGRHEANFRLRKVGDAAFILQHPMENVGDILLRAKAPEIKSGKWSVTNLRSYYEFHTEARDLEVVARYDAEGKDWEITYRALFPEGGVLLSKQELFTAPEAGYQPSVTFRTGGIGTDALSRQSQYFLYMKTRTPVLYAKFHVYQLIGQPREYPQCDFEVTVKSWTNPYGEQNFEPLQPTQENWLLFKEHTRYCLQSINEGRRADPKHLADLLAKPPESP